MRKWHGCGDGRREGGTGGKTVVEDGNAGGGHLSSQQSDFEYIMTDCSTGDADDTIGPMEDQENEEAVGQRKSERSGDLDVFEITPSASIESALNSQTCSILFEYLPYWDIFYKIALLSTQFYTIVNQLKAFDKLWRE